MHVDEADRVYRELREAAAGPPEAYAQVLERALAACEADPAAEEYLDVLELHDELADAYDRLGRVEDALRHADALVEQGYECEPDPRCRRAEILTRHGRLEEAAAIWDEVARDTPDDVWLYNNAGLEYAAIGEHELALGWLTKGLELAVRTGDPERLVRQLRELRAESLAAVGREPDRLQFAEPRPVARTSAPRPGPAREPAEGTRGHAGQPPVAWAWLPGDEYAQLKRRWPDIADGPAARDETGGVVDHATYCRRMEGRLREAREAGMTALRIAPLRWAEYTAWRQANEEEGEAAQLRARYAADLGRDPTRVITWPPGRNERCWCGSGRKYKQCCGAPGAGGVR
ncbi:Tetratricopeptide repeat-containing protein [Modestobacter sp. DSM 44400]|uniref:SEC-C metal-binding domain-containing protein n=1 Tax=Modestobacter sp. DSM 44400 TaxID=1550230 RepID=UPI0008996CD8|nr:SEC-C metal-binding domain-containing protein [Modestobacter sp. DSM 44400]SDY87167.1 Tetratricopeptide repeat-containing protein [Modestobacter sp. DSM 44400]